MLKKYSNKFNFTLGDDTPTLHDLYHCVCKQYASQWDQLALHLGLDGFDIENISKDNEYNPNRSVACCTAVLQM